MNRRDGIAFLDYFIGLSYSFPCHGKDDGINCVKNFSAIVFQTPIEVMVTLEQMMVAFNEVAKIPFLVTSNVYGKSFSQSTRIYIRNARSLCEMIDMFTMTAGLQWRISDEGVIEVRRGNDVATAIEQKERLYRSSLFDAFVGQEIEL